MSVLPSDIVVYGWQPTCLKPMAPRASGAVDFTRRIAFYDITPTGNVDVISSSSSDAATKIVYAGRDFDRCHSKPDADVERPELGDRVAAARTPAICRAVGGASGERAIG